MTKNNVIELKHTSPSTYLYGKLRKAAPFDTYEALCDCVDSVANDAGWDSETKYRAMKGLEMGAFV